jgi:hypothetical protein
LPDVAAALEREVGEWQRQTYMGDLTTESETAGTITLRDRRLVAAQPRVELNELESLLFAAAEDIGERLSMEQQAKTRLRGVDSRAIDLALTALVERRLMVNVGERYLSLALRPNGD